MQFWKLHLFPQVSLTQKLQQLSPLNACQVNNLRKNLPSILSQVTVYALITPIILNTLLKHLFVSSDFPS